MKHIAVFHYLATYTMLSNLIECQGIGSVLKHINAESQIHVMHKE